MILKRTQILTVWVRKKHQTSKTELNINALHLDDDHNNRCSLTFYSKYLENMYAR